MDADKGDETLERFFAALAEAAGTPRPGPAEVAAVLDLARVVAHSSERRFAPLACYVAGLAIGGEDSAEDEAVRTARLRRFSDTVEDLTGRGDATG